MGGKCAKENEPKLLTRQEHRFIESCFRTLSHNKEHLKRKDLQAWNYLADPEYVKYTRKACFRHSEQARIKLKTFSRHFYVVVKGSASEKAAYIVNEVFRNTDDLLEKVTTVQMLALVTSILRSYCIILSQNKPSEFTSWNERGVVVDSNDLKYYAHFLIGGLTDTSSVDTAQLERWLNNSQMFCHIWREVLISLCNHMNPVELTPYPGHTPLPECRVSDRGVSIQSALSVASVIFINEFLPTPYRRTWTLLFSSKLHGENFTFLITKIIHQGPTIILVKDECDHLFGGFAKTSWALGPNFHGDERTLLFTLKPNMTVYRSSGLNNHYQYLNMNQQTMPNGLGMGGQFNYWGLWVDANLSNGQSVETCTTFSGFKQMSGHKLFQVRHIEVWSVCERLLSLGAITSLDHDTVLLARNEEKYFLQLTGHNFRSDGEVDESERTERPNL